MDQRPGARRGPPPDRRRVALSHLNQADSEGLPIATTVTAPDRRSPVPPLSAGGPRPVTGRVGVRAQVAETGGRPGLAGGRRPAPTVQDRVGYRKAFPDHAFKSRPLITVTSLDHIP